MPRGRKPKPSHLKVVTGTLHPSRENRQEPKPKVSMPSPPSHLSEEAKEEWERLCKDLYNLGILTELDRAALAAYCQAYGRWVQAERAFAEMAEGSPSGGMVVMTKNDNAIHNPLVGAANKAMADMMRYASEFGMTPSSRSRIKSDGQAEEDPAESYFG